MRLFSQFDLSKHNTLGLSATARWGARVNSAEDARDVALAARTRSLPLRILGGGSNVLLHRHFDGILALMGIEGCDIVERNDLVTKVVAGAGVDWQSLVRWTLVNGLPGLENLAGIPGTVGAAPVQNIGAYGLELAQRFHSLIAFDTKHLEVRRFNGAQCEFGYRDSRFKQEPGRYIILEVTFALPRAWQPITAYMGLETLKDASPTQIMDAVLKIRSVKLPDWRKIGNVGSFFHNPVVNEVDAAELRKSYPEMPMFFLSNNRTKLSAAWIIAQCGFKDFRVGSAGVSAQHALILVNHGGANEDDIAALANHIRQSAFVRFGIKLKQEPEWI